MPPFCRLFFFVSQVPKSFSLLEKCFIEKINMKIIIDNGIKCQMLIFNLPETNW